MNEIRFRTTVSVELIESCASDLSVARAARVSTGGAAKPPEDDAKLIQWLMRSRHGSPFEHNLFTFLVDAPIFVWREHMRHRIGSYNEESGRYKELAPVFYIPGASRILVQTGKPGAYVFELGTKIQELQVVDALKENATADYAAYRRMLDAGVAREVARMVLPVSIYSSAYVTMNARALMNFLSLRRRVEGSAYLSYPQREIEMVAEQYEQHFQRLMPATYAAFVGFGRVAP